MSHPREAAPLGLPGPARASRAQAIGQGQGIDAETPERLHVARWGGGVTAWRRVGRDLFELESEKGAAP